MTLLHQYAGLYLPDSPIRYKAIHQLQAEEKEGYEYVAEYCMYYDDIILSKKTVESILDDLRAEARKRNKDREAEKMLYVALQQDYDGDIKVSLCFRQKNSIRWSQIDGIITIPNSLVQKSSFSTPITPSQPQQPSPPTPATNGNVHPSTTNPHIINLANKGHGIYFYSAATGWYYDQGGDVVYHDSDLNLYLWTRLNIAPGPVPALVKVQIFIQGVKP